MCVHVSFSFSTFSNKYKTKFSICSYLTLHLIETFENTIFSTHIACFDTTTNATNAELHNQGAVVLAPLGALGYIYIYIP